MEVTTIEEYERGKYNPNDFIDGLRVTGEFSFDSYPITGRENHPVKKNALGELSLTHEGDTSRFNVIVIERTGVVDIEENKRVKRYFWLFFAVGKPMADGLELFPKGYKGRNVYRIYCCTDFRGYWPVGVASVVVARNEAEGRQLLKQKLKEVGIPLEGDGEFNLKEVNTDNPGVFILNDGSYQ